MQAASADMQRLLLGTWGFKAQNELSECLEHGCLPPMEHWGFRLYERILAVVKIALRILHVLDRPCSHPRAQCQTIRIPVREAGEGIDRLCDTLNVYWISSRVVVLRATGRFKKVTLVETQSSLEIRSKRFVPGRFVVMLEAVQIVPSVEIINPVILRFFGV